MRTRAAARAAQEEYLAALCDTSVSSVICFGRTGTGKTHTMMGVPDVPDLKGIMPRAFEDIFTNIKADSD